MSDPIIQANASLVRNGDFAEPLNMGWTRGSTNPAWTTLGGGDYEGSPIRFLVTGNRSSASQVIEVPKDLRPDARYLLSFLCESWHYADGRLELGIEGSSEPAQVITLAAGRLLSNRMSNERNADQAPMTFRPEKYEVELTLALKKNDKVRVSVISPASKDDEYERIIRITRIRILLLLDPLVLQQLTVDGQPLPPSRPLYLCLGASGSFQHRLGFVPAPGNAWLDTEASLTSEDNPQGAIVATPMLGEDHPLEGEWSLDCPVIEGDGPHDFSFNLLNKYTAAAYPLHASLGHHRLVFREVLEAAYYPVFEYEQNVRLGVQVASYYTGEPLAGQEVTWTRRGQRQGKAMLTNDQGWAYFDYAPSGPGDFVIEASVVSLYYASGVFTQAFDVLVLATDPLKEVMAIVDGKEALWDEKTGYPNRGSQYPVNLRLPANSPLLGTELRLHWEGDSPAELGVTVSPELEAPVPVNATELTWTLTCDDQLDGKFDLLLGCSKLLRPSRKKSMSLARNMVEIGEVREANKSPVVDENESVLLRVQVLHILTSGPGDPVVNALVDWEGPNGTVSTVTGAGGWASVLDTPKDAKRYTITAKVRAHADMQPVERAFAVAPLATSPWKDQVEFYLDDQPVDRINLGIACWRGKSHTFRVTPMADSPVGGKPMTLAVRDGEPGLGLVIGAPVETADGGWEWQLSSGFNASRSSLFELSLTSDAVSGTRELSGRLLSEKLADEGHIVLDQVVARLGERVLYPCLGAVHRYTFLPNALSPLIGLDLKLAWSGTPAGELEATVTPALDRTQAINAGGAAWVLDFTASSNNGEFALALALPQLTLTSTANPMELAHNKVRIETLHEAAVDPVVGQDRAWQWVRVISSFTRQPVAQVLVTWKVNSNSSRDYTNESGWSGYALAPAIAQTHTVQVLVYSFYDGYCDVRNMTVNALPSDPWKGLVVQFDRQPAQLWGGRTFFPRRKGEHTVELSVPEGSPLLDQYVTLGLTGTGPAQLGISFVPSALGVPRLLTGMGLRYTLRGGDLKDGSFALRLAASRLSTLSPANALSLGSGSQVLKIIANNRVHQTLDWGKELYEQVTVVSAVSGKPMVGWTVTWRSPDLGGVTTVTDFYGVARIRFKPVTTGAGELTATVGDELHSDTLSLTFTMNEPRKISELYEADNQQWPVEWESQAHAVTKVVSSRTGIPLEGVEVIWDYAGQALSPSLTDANGIARLIFTLTAEGHGVLSAAVKGGVGGWDTAQLLYGGLIPVIESLTCDRPVTYTGYEVNAWARVVRSPGGLPFKGIRINWSFAGGALPDSLTDSDGVASVTFMTSDIGEYDLVATQASGLPDSKMQRITVQPLQAARVYGMSADPLTLRVGESSNIIATVLTLLTLRPVVGRKVHWRIDGEEFDMTYTNAAGKASVLFHASQAGTVTIWAHVYNQNNEEVNSVVLNIIE